MANSPVLLDTSVVIRHFRRNPTVTAQMDAAEALFLPAVVLGELYHGAFRGRQRENELRSIQELLPAVTVLGITAKTAELFGQIAAELALAGTPIPTNDIWVAALAREHGLPVATDDAHFDNVRDLTALRW
ncbi:MAG: type II toxin-antitoxin system VapC family toxin [Verrucomicrobiales bacterium]|nr:type II toxin-antitoxin system VapC family toxin [Verrucomicrobiales bacterium]